MQTSYLSHHVRGLNAAIPATARLPSRRRRLERRLLPHTLLVASTLLLALTTQVQAQTIAVPVQFIRLADDDGSAQAAMTPAQAQGWIDFANQVYASANVQFYFNPVDSFTTVRSTMHNWWDGEIDAKELTLNFPDKMPILVGNIGGISNTLGDLILIQGYAVSRASDGTHQGWHMPHEIGHHLGLPHTFVEYGSRAEAENDLRNNNYDPSFWNSDGFSDTPPHPMWPGIGEIGGPSTLNILGVPITFPRTNIMAYMDGSNAITSQQGAMVRWWANYYSSHTTAAGLRWHYPTNWTAQSFVEAQDMTVTQRSNVSEHYQHRSLFNGPAFSLNWDDQLWLAFSNGGSITFRLTVSTAGWYDLSFYGLRNNDYGRVRFTIDGSSIGPEVDGYAPSVVPTGQIPLGSVYLNPGNHSFSVISSGKNSASGGYGFGFDSLQFLRQGQVLAPSIRRQPVAQVVDAGQTVRLSVTSYGTSLQYQWRKNGANIAGATGSVLTLANVSASTAGTYSVRVFNSAGQQFSNNAQLIVNPAPAAPFSFEGESFGVLWNNVVLAVNNVGSFSDQDMTGFGSGWSNGHQMLVDTRQTGSSITLGVPVEKAGTYNIDVYLTRADDFGRFQVYVDGVAVGSVIDLYSPSVQPTGAIRIGSRALAFGVRKVEFRCVGKNGASPRYALGVDKIVLSL